VMAKPFDLEDLTATVARFVPARIASEAMAVT